MHIKVGQSASISKTISESDIYIYSGITGDFNEIHINAATARGSVFHERVAHGLLTAGLISAVIGTRLPGSGSICLAHSLRFTAPVKIGDTVTAQVVVKEVIDGGKGIYRLDTLCINQYGVHVIEGDAVIKYTHSEKKEIEYEYVLQ